MTKRAFVFPGQGSQKIGMGKDLYEAFPIAKDVFEEVDDVLSQRLSKIMFEGPEDQLVLTENTQPALMAVSMAVMRVLEAESGKNLPAFADVVAGHSLGEYSALCAAGALSLGQTARLLKIRGQAMQKAVPVGMGAMAALLGLDFEAAQDIARMASGKDFICEAANDNAPGQVVISGHRQAVERAMELATEKGAKRTVLLPVSAPFHCQLMQPAADRMEEELAKTTIEAPVVPLITNVTAHETQIPEDIRRMLVKQVTGVVRWRESVLRMEEENVEVCVEAGAGKVLSGLVKRIAPSITGIALNTPKDIEAFMAGLE